MKKVLSVNSALHSKADVRCEKRQCQQLAQSRNLKSEEGHSSKQTVFRRDSETRAYMDVFTACLRGLCPFRCSLTSQRTLSSNCQHHVALPLCSECNLQQTQPLRQPPYSLGFLNFSTIWFTSPMALCLAFSSSVPAIVGGKDQMPDG